jgi:hypothetical protein
MLLPVLVAGNLSAFWRDTISYQETRGAPFSIWGLWGGLSFPQHLVQGAAVALALIVAVRPRTRTTIQVAALGASVLIALQLGITYWFYLYIPWFLPLVLLGIFGIYGERRPAAVSDAPARAPARSTPLAAAARPSG